MLRLRHAVVFLFVFQVFSGLLLMTVYSPSTTTAWGSVWYIQTRVSCGWIIRGLHHFASDAMILLLTLYAAGLLITKRYRAPHYAIWWATLLSLGLAMGLSLSGHLLPWDQEGYWGTKVRTNILARTPWVGEGLAKLLIGGTDFGNLTLSRFYTLHIVILPFVMGLLIFRYMAPRVACGADPSESHGAEVPQRHRPKAPAHLLSGSSIAAVLLMLLTTTWYVRTILGSQLLDGPADPMATDYPARPEWHTLFLYQWLKAFEGPVFEVLGAIVLPSVIVLAFPLLPFLGRIFSPPAAHRAALAWSAAIAMSIMGLTLAAHWDDRDPGDERVNAVREKQRMGATLSEGDEAVLRARHFNRRRDQAAREAKRALELAASDGIPPDGPSALLARDPLTAGPKLFATHCSTCHRYDGHDGTGNVPLEPATSSDLVGFASPKWIRGLLANPMDDRYFGRMRTPEGEPAHTRMAKLVSEIMPESEEARRLLLADFNAVATFLASPSSPPDAGQSHANAHASLVGRGREVFINVCNECHSYDGERKGTTRAPEMFAYGSVGWIELMIAEPDHESRYRAVGRERARMPRFKDKLTEREIRMIATWLNAGKEVELLSD